ncbi:hypothetical protein L0Y40_01795 [Candidatus Wolfebacteria bacterium]|nr:hypothetical protein [Candidatus Wolfebacteria bacterium]
MNQKGTVGTVILVVVVLVAVGGVGGYVAYQNRVAGSTSIDNWVIYTDTKYGFEIEHPRDFVVKEWSPLGGVGIGSSEPYDTIPASVILITIADKDHQGQFALGPHACETSKQTELIIGERSVTGCLRSGPPGSPEDIFAFFEEGDRAVRIQCNSAREDVEKTCRTMARTFRLIPPARPIKDVWFEYCVRQGSYSADECSAWYQ